MKISYQIPLIQQGIQECVQAAAAQILPHYGLNKSLLEIKQEVPVYVDSAGVTRGTSLGHIATYFQKLGLHTSLHTSDILIFDPSWRDLSNKDLIDKLTLRTPHLVHGWYDKETLSMIVDGYIQYLQHDGQIIQPVVDIPYILQHLYKGPLYMVVSYNVLNLCAKYDFSQENQQDDIKGLPATHAIVISGYSNGMFDVVDPDFNFGGYRKIPESLLLAAYYTAVTDMDSLFISFTKK